MSFKAFLAVLALAALSLVLACSGGGGGGSTTYAKSGDWVDNNSDGVYDPYQDSSLWKEMNTFTSAAAAAPSWLGPRPAFAAQQRAWKGSGNPSPQWRDRDGDGICDYAQDPHLWSQYHTGDWVDNNGDGICDNYPNSSHWKNGWR